MCINEYAWCNECEFETQCMKLVIEINQGG